jgi:hypothetical protein
LWREKLENLWNDLIEQIEAIGGKQHMGEPKAGAMAGINAGIKEETQIEQLLDIAISDFKAAIVEYKRRLDASLLHAKARIAQLEADKGILRSMIVELRKEKEQVRGIVEEWDKK